MFRHHKYFARGGLTPPTKRSRIACNPLQKQRLNTSRKRVLGHCRLLSARHHTTPHERPDQCSTRHAAHPTHSSREWRHILVLVHLVRPTGDPAVSDWRLSLGAVSGCIFLKQHGFPPVGVHGRGRQSVGVLHEWHGQVFLIRLIPFLLWSLPTSSGFQRVHFVPVRWRETFEVGVVIALPHTPVRPHGVQSFHAE